jgi:hypothetical protein
MNNPNDPQSGENSSPPSSGRGGDGGAGSGNAVEFSSERAYNLIRLELLEEVKGELFNWAKKKLSWIVVILLLLGFGGIHFIIQQLVSSSEESRITDELALVEKQVEGATLATVQANVAAQRANEATEKAVNKANDYIDTVEKLSAKAEQVNTQFAAVRLRFDQESLHSRERAEQDKKELQDQIT